MKTMLADKTLNAYEKKQVQELVKKYDLEKRELKQESREALGHFITSDY